MSAYILDDSKIIGDMARQACSHGRHPDGFYCPKHPLLRMKQISIQPITIFGFIKVRPKCNAKIFYCRECHSTYSYETYICGSYPNVDKEK